MHVNKKFTTEIYEMLERNVKVKLAIEILHCSKMISYRLTPWADGTCNRDRFEIHNTKISMLEDFSEIFKKVALILSKIKSENPDYEIEGGN